MSKTFFLVLLYIASSVAFAEGGKNRAQNPVLVDACPSQMPGLVDQGICEAFVAPSQAGVSVYFCESEDDGEGSVIVCADD